MPSARTIGNAVRYAVKPTSAAVAIISQWPLPGTERDRREPATDAGTPNADVMSTMRPRMRCSRLYRNEPEIDDGRIDGSVEPIASNVVAPSTRIAGVVMTAPPMPNIPERTPERNPTATVRTNCSTTGKAAEGTRHAYLRLRDAAGGDYALAPWRVISI